MLLIFQLHFHVERQQIVDQIAAKSQAESICIGLKLLLLGRAIAEADHDTLLGFSYLGLRTHLDSLKQTRDDSNCVRHLKPVLVILKLKTLIKLFRECTILNVVLFLEAF